MHAIGVARPLPDDQADRLDVRHFCLKKYRMG
jgi:hypothetical protein